MEELLLFLLYSIGTLIWEAFGWILFELFGHVLLEAFVQMGKRSLTEPFVASTLADPLWAVPGVLIMGGVAGTFITLLFNTRLITPVFVPGLSLVLMPLVAGYATRWLGRMFSGDGRERIYLVTYAGGAFFAFGLAALRLLLVSPSA